jgi:hypothetical protein
MGMEGMEDCPKCGAQFETRPAIVDLGQSRGIFNLPSIPPRVACPGCRYQFRAKNMRYFGFITANRLRNGLAIYAALFVVIAFVFLFWQDPAW